MYYFKFCCVLAVRWCDSLHLWELPGVNQHHVLDIDGDLGPVRRSECAPLSMEELQSLALVTAAAFTLLPQW